MQAIEYETQRNTSLFVGVIFSPSFPYWHIEACQAFLNAKKPQLWMLDIQRSHGIASARNNIVLSFLKTNYSHLMLLDSDVILFEDTIARMLQLDENVVIAHVPQKPNGGVPCIEHSELPFNRGAPVTKEDDTRPVKRFMLCSLGCVLIKRHVFEKMDFPYFRYASQEFDALPDWYRVSEDYYFFVQLEELGIKPVFLPTAKAKHIISAALEPSKGLVNV